MKKVAFCICLLLCVTASSFPRQTGVLKLTGPYLGQKPPGIHAEVFAPGIVSTEANEVLIGFFHDGQMCLFERSPVGSSLNWTFIPILVTRREGDTWTTPVLSSPGGMPWFHGYAGAPEGTTVCFAWNKNLDGSGPARDIDIWRTVREAVGWSRPENLGWPVSSEAIDSWPSLTRDQTLYFFSSRPGGFGRADLYRARLERGRYREVEHLGRAVNSQHADHDPFIAPDERYLLWCSDRPGGSGANDLYVSFRQADGTWSEAANLGPRINSPSDDTRPVVTADGKYLFFNRAQAGNRDVFWADARIIEALRPAGPATRTR